MCLGLCGVYIFVGYDIGLCGSELVFIPGWVGVESSWVGVEFMLKVPGIAIDCSADAPKPLGQAVRHLFPLTCVRSL